MCFRMCGRLMLSASRFLDNKEALHSLHLFESNQKATKRN